MLLTGKPDTVMIVQRTWISNGPYIRASIRGAERERSCEKFKRAIWFISDLRACTDANSLIITNIMGFRTIHSWRPKGHEGSSSAEPQAEGGAGKHWEQHGDGRTKQKTTRRLGQTGGKVLILEIAQTSLCTGVHHLYQTQFP